VNILEELLFKIRKFGYFLNTSTSIDFFTIAAFLSDMLEGSVYIISKTGGLSGYAILPGFECQARDELIIKANRIPEYLNSKMLLSSEPVINQPQKGSECIFLNGVSCMYCNKFFTWIPVVSHTERLGTLLVSRFAKEFSTEDIIILEHASAVIGMEKIRLSSKEREEEVRKKTTVQVALASLSLSERDAIESVMTELKAHNEGVLVTSKIAQNSGITRSVIVNALKKIESAGVIDVHSLGMRGTYIKVVNNYLREELNSGIKHTHIREILKKSLLS
jgi:transcriptional pleiotropic repressor